LPLTFKYRRYFFSDLLDLVFNKTITITITTINESEFIFCQPRSSVAVCCQLNYAITLGSSVASCRQPRPLWDSHRPLEVYLFAQFSLIVNRIRTPGRTEGPAEGHFVRSPQRVLLTLIKFRPVPWSQICTENKSLE